MPGGNDQPDRDPPPPQPSEPVTPQPLPESAPPKPIPIIDPGVFKEQPIDPLADPDGVFHRSARRAITILDPAEDE